MKNSKKLFFMLSILSANLGIQAMDNDESKDYYESFDFEDFKTLQDVLNFIEKQKKEGTYDGGTPLHFIADGDGNEQELKIAIELIKNGADVNDQNNTSRETPLHVAADSEHFELIRALVHAGSHINAQDINGRTALHYISYGSTKDDDNNVNIAKFLIENGADVSIKDIDGKTAIEIGAEENAHPVLQAMLIDALAKKTSK